MIKCAAKYCNNETNNSSNFFRFPSSSFTTRRSLWVKRSGADISPNDNECFLCPRHFGSDQFRNRSLKWDAVPKLHLDELPYENDEKEKEIVAEKSKKKRKKIAELPVEVPPVSFNDTQSSNSTDDIFSTITPSKPNSPQPAPPPPPLDNDIIDFEAEIDRLKDPLCAERPAKKRRDEDVRTQFTEEDDIPLEKLFMGVKKVNTFNANIPLEPRVPLPEDVKTINADSPTSELQDNPETILCDTASYGEKEMSNGTVTVKSNGEESCQSSVMNKPNTESSECLCLCSHCDFYTSSEEQLRDHENEAHKDKDTSKESAVSKVYPFKILTKSNGQQFYLCDFCTFAGKEMSSLISHMVKHFPKESQKGKNVQKYCATIAFPGKDTKDVVTVSMTTADSVTEVVEIEDDDNDLSNIVISNVTAGKKEVQKLLTQPKKQPARKSPRKRK